MSENYKIKYSSKDQFYVMVVKRLGQWLEQLETVSGKMGVISGMESFQGATADSVKAYLNEVHNILLISVRQTIADFQYKVSFFSNGYYDIESNIYATISSETLQDLKTRADSEQTYLDEKKTALQAAINTISDLEELKNPSQENILGAFKDTSSKVETLDKNISEYETAKKTEAGGELAELIAALAAAISAFYANPKQITQYEPGAYAGSDAVVELYKKVSASMEYTTANQEAALKASENIQAVFEQQQKDYEEACEARKDEGSANMILGALAVVGGVAAIVLTAGAATPIVAVAVVSGTCAAAYGVSNMVEGAQDYYYGSIGDLSSGAWNPIRDTVFCGNQGLYDAWGSLSLTVAGLCVPVNSAVNSVAGASGKVIAKEVAKTVVKESVKGYVIGEVSDGVTNVVAEKLDLNKTQTVILNQVVEAGIEKGVDAAEKAYVKHRDGAADGDFTDRMSYEDAKRYNEYMKDPDAYHAKLDSMDPTNGAVDAADVDLPGDHNGLPSNDGAAVKPDFADGSTVNPDGSALDGVDMADTPVSADTPSVTDAPDVADTPSVTDTPDVTDTPTATDTPNLDGSNSPDGVDYTTTMNTPEEQAIIQEMEANGEFVDGKHDYGAVEVDPSRPDPKDPNRRLPTDKKGTIIGDRESGTFEYIPDDKKTQSIMAEYGETTIKYTNDDPNFSPYTKHDTQWGKVDCEVEIGHMVGDRQGTVDNPGNYDQADIALSEKISAQTGQEVTPQQVEAYRKENGLTWHECSDGSTMQLIPTEINANCAHSGGVSVSKYQQAWGDLSLNY